jgi:phosphopantetheinyl transferase (holo-ACP synthase)
MVGIDITRISRFRSMNNLPRFISKFNVDGTTPIAAAKTWACLESLFKAKGTSFGFTNIRIEFPKNSAPRIVDPDNVLDGTYHLTLSHEDDLVVAVALKVRIT